MKHLFFTSIVLTLALQSSAFAENSISTEIPAAEAPNSATAVTTGNAEAFKAPAFHGTYVGFFNGPGLNTAESGKTKDGSDIYVSNRLSVKRDLSQNIDAGLQARIATSFTSDGVKANNEYWRLFASFKKLASLGIISLDLIPRVMLPSTIVAHNSTMLPSPELIAAFNINPSDSRFSFVYTTYFQKYLYNNDSAALSNKATTFDFTQSLEANYQLGKTTQINVGYWPEYTSTKTAAITTTSNEVDVGMSWDFAKGWTLSPFIATEMNGLDTASIGKKMQANLILSGAFL